MNRSFSKTASFLACLILIITGITGSSPARPVAEDGIYSGAWADLPGGELTNPAGAAMTAPGTTFLSYHPNSERLRMSLNTGLLGTLGWYGDAVDDEGFFNYTFGFRTGWKTSFGFTWWSGRFDSGAEKTKGWNYGFLHRPLDCLSLGFAAMDFTNPDLLEYSFSAGLRAGSFIPSISDRITLTADCGFLDSDTETINYSVGFSTELIDGIALGYRFGSCTAENTENTHHLGLTFHSPHISAGYYADAEDPDGGTYTMSGTVPRRRSIVNGPARIGEIVISGDMPDRSGYSFFEARRPDLWGLKKKLAEAEEREEVKGILLKIGPVSCGLGKIQEIADLIVEFRNSGKKVVAFLESAGHSQYLLATTADRIVIAPGGGVFIPGFLAEPMFFKGTLEKLGVEADLLRIGDHKSAVEPFTRDSFSDSVREEMTRIIYDEFDQFTSGVAGFRESLTENEFRDLVNDAVFTPEDALERKLIDGVGYDEDAEKLLAELCDIDFPEKRRLARAGLDKVGALRTAWSEPRKAIVVIEARGNITSGPASGESIFSSANIGSDTYVELIRKLKNDRSVSGVVLRVDSGGGSGLASDLIWNELEHLQEDGIPVVASVENIAGSGGYYIICGADEIIANPAAIVGSIGVMGGKIVTTGLYDKLGITRDIIKAGENADLNSSNSKFSERQKTILLKHMESFYTKFVGIVADGREMSFEEVDALGGGRIYTAREACENGLVDSSGGLFEAIDACAELAGLEGEYSIHTISPGNKFPMFNREYGKRAALAELLFLMELYREIQP